MQTPRLVASDVDGTLLAADERPSRRTVEVLRRVDAAGVPFVMVTGRPPSWMTEIAALVGLPGLVVCANGAVLYDSATRAVLHAETLDPVLLSDAAHALRSALPGCGLAVERLGGEPSFLCEPGYRHAWPNAEYTVVPPARLVGHPAVKLLVRQPDMTSDAMAVAAKAVLGDSVEVTFSAGNGLVELSARGTTKGSGLAAVARHHGVPPEEVVAFGDMPNDLPMLAFAGHAVAVANAHPDVLAAADEVTGPNVADGVAEVLERWY